jgi:hypothetical protein
MAVDQRGRPAALASGRPRRYPSFWNTGAEIKTSADGAICALSGLTACYFRRWTTVVSVSAGSGVGSP